MKPSRFLSFWRALASFGAVLTFAAVPAALANDVSYSPAQVEVEGNMPYSQPSTFRIFKPQDVTTATVTLHATADVYPMGTAEEAISYISFSPSTVTFAAGETEKTVTVTATFPALNVPPDTNLVFQYKVVTSGWGVPVSDAGMNINATVTAPPPAGAGLPIVTITGPTDPVYTYSATELPASIPFTFQAATASPSAIFSIDATMNGLPITFTPSGVGTILATGTGNLAISGPGVYTIVARGANAQGDAETSKTITVIVDGPPPEVVIASPAVDSNYTYFVGGSPARVPVSFTATTPSGTAIQNLSATLNGASLPISVTGGALNTQSVTGTIPLDLTVSGQYTLGIKAFNQYGEAETTTTFWINRMTNPASQTVFTGGSASFSVVVTGVPNFTFQWSRQAAGTVGFVPVTDGGIFSGATTATLSISGAAMGMNGDKYQCLVTGLSPVASAPATLTVLSPSTSLAPTIVINYPTSADVILPVGQLTTNLNFRFTSTPQSGSSIDAVTSAFDSVSVSSSTTPTLPTAQEAVSTGTLVNVGAGVHTFTATARSGTASAAATVSFRVIVTDDPAPSCGTAIVRHSAVMNGNAGIEGSLQILLSEDMALNGNAWISGDLLLPGTPSLRLNGPNATIGSQIEGNGSAFPSGAKLTLNGNALIARLVSRTNPVSLPVVAAPPVSTGSRSVKLNKSTESVGSFATLRDLTINGSIGLVAIAPGTYRDFTVNGSNNGMILGVAGATEPSVYNFRNLTLNGRTEVKVVGPVVITVANAVAFNGEFGNADHTGWVTLRIADGGLTLNGTGSFFGTVIAPNGTVTLNGLDVLKGGLASDRLVINGQGLVDLCDDDGSPQIDEGQ